MKNFAQAEILEKKPRADALRNRALLVSAAKQVFAEKGTAATLDEIAKSAGVGIGTLYRHFPAREDIVDAVYQAESEQIFNAAHDLAARLPPVDALHQWMLQFVDYMEVKQGMSEILNASSQSPRKLKPSGPYGLKDAADMLLARAKATGEIKLEGEPMDLLRAIAGVLNMNTSPNRKTSARQLVDVMIAGLRAL